MSLTLVVAAAFLAYVAIPYFGNKALIVRSGSMQPAIGVGDLVVVRGNDQLAKPISAPFPKYKTGDIVAFSSEHDKNILTTHRIASVQNQEGRIVYQTKGDANDSPDENLIAEDKILGKSIFTIVGLGKVFALAKTKQGFLSLVVAPAILVILFELYSIFREIIRIRRKKILPDIPEQTTWQSSPNNILLKVLLPFVIGIMFFQGSFASYADVETASGNSLEAAAVFAPQVSPSPSTNPSPSSNPSLPCSATSGESVVINEVNWVGSTGDGLDEWIELCNTTNSPIDLTNWVVEKLGTGNGPNANVTIPSGILPANGFFIISNNDQSNSKINVPSDLVDTNVSLDNGGEQLVLKNSGGTVIDTANGIGAWFEGDNSTPKKSMERKTPVGDGTVASSWQTATTHTNMDASGPTDEFGTPKAPNGS